MDLVSLLSFKNEHCLCSYTLRDSTEKRYVRDRGKRIKLWTATRGYQTRLGFMSVEKVINVRG